MRARRSPALRLLLALPLAACSMPGETTSATVSEGDVSGDSTGTGAGETTTGATATASSTATASTTASTTTAGDACGNGVIDPGELCDGADLGGQTCAGLGAPYVGGDLACAAGCAAFDASACQVDAAAPKVRLNEVLAKGAESGDFAGKGDLLELINIGAAPADLAGWRLSDEPDFPADKTFIFPPGAVLAPGAYLVLFEYDAMSGEGDLPFGISSQNPEAIALADAGGVVVDAVAFNGPDAAVSWCRVPDGDGAWQTCLQTPGVTNQAGTGAFCGDGVRDDGEACDGADLGGKACPDVGEYSGGDLACTPACTFDTAACLSVVMVAVNELSSSDADPIELYNAGAAPLDLSGWILTDDADDPYDPEADLEELVFPPGTTLAPGAFLVVEKGEGPLQHPFGLGAGGDTVRLFNQALQQVDAVTYPADAALVSYCRLPDGPGGAWQAGCAATFGAANQP